MIYLRALLSLVTHNFGTKMISILIAFVLWSIVMGSRPAVRDKEVALKVITAEDMVVVSRVPPSAHFRISGPNTLLRSILSRNDAPIEIDLRNSKPGMISYHLDTDSIQQYSGVKTISVNPSSIDFVLEEVTSKSVPVRLETRGTPEEGFHLVASTFFPPEVMIRGARSQVEKIGEVATMPVDISKMKQSDNRPYKLDLQSFPHVQSVGEMPKLTLTLEAVSANFKIRNVPVRVISPLQSSVNEKSVTVFVRASQEALNTLDQTKVFAEVDLTGKAKGAHTAPVTVKLPTNISLVRTQPERVQVKLF
ncbi:MAG: YbbR-like domain-containing protein [Bacteriovoracia bacterium]